MISEQKSFDSVILVVAKSSLRVPLIFFLLKKRRRILSLDWITIAGYYYFIGDNETSQYRCTDPPPHKKL